jgi:hypothetical protein
LDSHQTAAAATSFRTAIKTISCAHKKAAAHLKIDIRQNEIKTSN